MRLPLRNQSLPYGVFANILKMKINDALQQFFKTCLSVLTYESPMLTENESQNNAWNQSQTK